MSHNELRVLFVTKKRNEFYGISFGLLNSATFMANALAHMGMQAKVVEVIDNNGIDKEVFDYKPTHVVIEALWVVPEKFDVLLSLHPHVKWVVRIHSNIPFLAHEGMAIEWLYGYKKNMSSRFKIATNNCHCHEDFDKIGIPNVLLPNVYEPGYRELDKKKHGKKDEIHVGCFGAVRPMKNHLEQAIAAIKFADIIGKKLHFHINYDRVEQKGESALKNLQVLFANLHHELVEHPWCSHKDFLKIVASMDIGMQVSLSETFNIVSADFVNCDVPIVVSKQIEWLPDRVKADPTDVDSIVGVLRSVWQERNSDHGDRNEDCLERHNQHAKHAWKEWLLNS